MSNENSIKFKLKVNFNNEKTIQKLGLKRNTIDKYYTSVAGVSKCMLLISKYIKIDKHCDICIEPSAGDGAFINSIKKICDSYKFYDLKPDHTDIIKLDYLEYDHTKLTRKINSKIHVIGNPPFGRQSSLVIKFIKKSALYCNTISFILPKSFKKNSLKKHFPLNFWPICEEDLPEKSFVVNGKPHDVPCVFQIWEKRLSNRKLPEKLLPEKFTFVKKDQPHDISFRRVGVYAGKIATQTDEKSPQSHYFIKFNTGVSVNDQLLNKIKAINYKSSEYTVGQKSISKQELIKEFNQILT